MNQNRNQHTASKKVEILREYLENQVSISELSRRYGISPNLIYKWKKQLFEGAKEIFSRQHEKVSLGQSARTGKLEEKIKDKDSLITEQIAEYIRFYNEERLHSALFYLTPKEVLEGKMEQRLEERQKSQIKLPTRLLPTQEGGQEIVKIYPYLKGAKIPFPYEPRHQ